MMDGKLIGNYQIRAEIGRGGMATVYRAYQPSTDREVALKVVHPLALDSATLRERFRREARTVARLEHPHILPIYDFDDSHDPPYLVMRLLPAGTLRDQIVRQTISSDQVVVVVDQLASALDYAHDQGVIHRDIKPSNILVDQRGNVFLTDFGIAQVAYHYDDAQITNPGTIVGTPDYIAPEQATGEGKVTARADIYSLGVIIFQLLTGSLPFLATQPMAMILQHLQAPIPLATAFNPHLPSAIDGFFQRALAKLPSERFGRAGDLAHALRTILIGRNQYLPDVLLAAPETMYIEPAAEAKALIEERRNIVVMVIDASHYAALIEAESDPAQARSATASLWELALRRIAEHGGALLQRNSQECVALWGVAQPLLGEGIKAVDAALQILADLQQALPNSQHQLSLPFGIGLHTGQALISMSQAPGDDSTMIIPGLSASGNTLMVARRIAEQAEGLVAVSDDLRRELAGRFVVHPHGDLAVRGHRASLALFRVAGRQTHPLTPPSLLLTRDLPLIGREAELQRLLHGFDQVVQAQRPLIASLIGPAGMGKAAMLNEFAGRLAEDDPAPRIARLTTDPFARYRPYTLWLQMLRELLELPASMSHAEAAAAIRAQLSRHLPLAHPEAVRSLAYLLGLEARQPHRTAQPQSHPEDLYQLAIAALIALIGSQPLILIVDELHHADHASLALCEQLIGQQPPIALYLVVAAEQSLHEHRPRWLRHDANEIITLAPLSRREMRLFAEHQMQLGRLNQRDLRDLLVERSEGNPLLCREFFTWLIAAQIILPSSEPDLAWQIDLEALKQTPLPADLRAIFHNRIANLEPHAALVLQRAALIGDQFDRDLLNRLDLADDLTLGDAGPLLASLQANQFIDSNDGNRFRFVRAEVRAFVYHGLSEPWRQHGHRVLATWLARSEDSHEQLARIADHYERSGDLSLSTPLWLRLGESARQRGALDDSLLIYQRALTMLSDGWWQFEEGHLDSEMLATLLPPALLARAEALLSTGRLNAARSDLELALGYQLTAGQNDHALLLLAEQALRSGEYRAARAYVEPLIAEFRAQLDQLRLIRALICLSELALAEGDYESAGRLIDEISAMTQATQDARAELHAQFAAAWAAYGQTNQASAIAALQRIAALHGRAELGSLPLRAELGLATIFYEAGEQSAARAALAAAEAQLPFCPDLLAEAELLLVSTMIRHTEATSALRAALEISLTHGATPLLLRGMAELAARALARSQFRRAAQLVAVASTHPALDLLGRSRLKAIQLPIRHSGELPDLSSLLDDWLAELQAEERQG